MGGEMLLQQLIAESGGAILDRLARAGAGHPAEDAKPGRGDTALAYGAVSVPLLEADR